MTLAPSATAASAYLLLQASGQPLAVAACDVLEVLGASETLVEVPRRDACIVGVVAHRGRHLPVTSLARWHAAEGDSPPDAGRSTLVCVLHAGGRRLGLQVDRLVQVAQRPASSLHRLCHRAGRGELFGTTLDVEGRPWPVLDVPALFEVAGVWDDEALARAAVESTSASRPAEPLVAVFRIDTRWYATPARAVLQVCEHEGVQRLSDGQGPLTGAVAWRSQPIPLIRLGAAIDGHGGTASRSRLMLVLRGGGDASGSAPGVIALDIDEVDRLHRAPGRPGVATSVQAPDVAPAPDCMSLDSGRVVTLVCPDRLASEFSFGAAAEGSPSWARASDGAEGRDADEFGRTTEPYLVYQDGEALAIPLSTVDEVVRVPADGPAAQAVADGHFPWRGELLPLAGRSEGRRTAGAREPLVIRRVGPRRQAMRVEAVHFIVSAGAGSLRSVVWPGRGRIELLTTTVDGTQRSVRVVSPSGSRGGAPVSTLQSSAP